MARRRVKVGTLMGTEDRNDDDTILRTPRLQFGPQPSPAPAPTETTTPPSRVESPPNAPSGDGREGGDGSGSNGPSGNSQPGSRDPTLADFTESAIAAASSMDPSTAPAGLAKGIGIAADVLGSIPSDMFGEMGEKAGVGMQNKSQAVGTVAQAQAMMGKQPEEKQEPQSQEYAPPSPTFNPEEPAYNPQEYQDLSAQAGDTNAPGNDTMGPGQDFSSNDMSDGGSGTDAGVGDGTGGDTGGGGAAGPGGEGGPGDPAGSPGSGAFKKGVIDIEGPDPTKQGEAIPDVTLHEGETVLTDAETTIIGEDNLRKFRRAVREMPTLARRNLVRSTLMSRG